MRQIVLDTETTGLEVNEGHRILEIGCVELKDRRVTAQHFHRYLNPERAVDAGALAIHGLDNEMLAEYPRFAEIAKELVAYLDGADEILIHNASFDTAFVNMEFEALGEDWGRLEDYGKIVDTLALAKHKRPGQRNGLDALCKHFQIDNSARQLHGALLDAQLLAEVYLALTGGQTSLALGHEMDAAGGVRRLPSDRAKTRIIYATDAENLAHAAHPAYWQAGV